MSLHSEYKKEQYDEIRKQLDETNIRILAAMWKFGPRNILEISRRLGMPFTSVYHRIARIESKSDEIAFLMPPTSKLGLVRLAVLVTASPGCEDQVTQALKAPNLWRSVGFCEGTFTHISIQLVPAKYLKEFRSYLQELVDIRLVTNLKVIYTGDYIANFPNFDYYDPKRSEWKFDWAEWLLALSKDAEGVNFSDPASYVTVCSKKEMTMVSLLQLDAREKFVDMAKVADMTPDGVKYHYQKLVDLGILNAFQFRVLPFPIEASAYHEIMLEFDNENGVNRFAALVPKLFFVVGLAKVLRRNTLMVQTWMPESQVRDMYSFFSQMAREGFLESYSAVRIDVASRQGQSISDELFDDENGWTVDFEKCSSELPVMEEVMPRQSS